MKKVTRVIGFLFFLFSSLTFIPSLMSVFLLIGAALLFPMERWQSFIKERLRLKSGVKVLLVVVLFFASVITMPESEGADEAPEQAKAEEEVALEPEQHESKQEPVAAEPEPEEKVAKWKEGLPAGLAQEIEDAFVEIGEDPDNIVAIEHVDTHTSGYIFERKCYRVEFSYSFLNPGWKHSKEYRVTTQNYFDGEPEKAEYPDEFLVTLKFWAGDDGHGTNINQWSWSGGGELQDW